LSELDCSNHTNVARMRVPKMVKNGVTATTRRKK
jgi:hypothetical protein